MHANMDAIPRVARLTPAEFATNHLAASKPVIVTEELADWAAPGKWTLALLEQYGERPVQVEHYPSGNRSDAFSYQTMTLGEYIHLVREHPQNRTQYYLAERTVRSILEECPDVANAAPQISDLKPLSFLAPSQDVRQMVFVGVDTFSTAHYHRMTSQAVLCQIQGRKRLRLIPPSSLKYMYLLPWYSVRGNHSRIRFDGAEKPDSQAYPKLAQAKTIECVLEPGDALFIPDHWMHIVEGIGENISVTYFWDSDWRQAHLPGVVRDSASAAVKSAMVGVANLSSRLGTNRVLVNFASMLGVVGKEDRSAVLRHLDEFGAKRPHEQ